MSKFRGAFVAIVTPFIDGKLDEQGLQDLIEFQIAGGTHGIVPCGTTGESATMSHAEHHRVVELTIKTVAGRVPVLAGTGSNSTSESIELTRAAKAAGADGALMITPYYNKPTQEGLYQHYKAIHDAVDLPIIIYNIPGRSIVDMSVATMARLAKLPRIAGVKDATNDLARPMRTRIACGKDFCILSGEDATAIPLLAGGGHGCISVTANIAPRLCADMHKAWQAGDMAKVMDLQEHLMPLHDAMFCETSPGPVKYAASLLGKCTAEARLPLCEIAETSKQRVKEAMAAAGLL